ncbi:MAG: T9SS type A sorting domain-containing protein, partial [Bacteroidia bacterium]|nr:T9SS type A sorting domain-containing protein [Bacteroidia bacterium]
SWYIRSTASGNNFAYGVAQLKDGNYISVGNIDSDGSVDVFLVKYDLIGNTCCGAAVGVTNALLATNSGVYGLDSIGGVVDSGGVASSGGAASIICNSPVGVESVSQAEDVLLYPNPAKGELNISNVLEFDRVIIMNALGVKVYDETISSKEKISIQLSTFSPGTYFVNLRSKNKQVTKKLHVE